VKREEEFGNNNILTKMKILIHIIQGFWKTSVYKQNYTHNIIKYANNNDVIIICNTILSVLELTCDRLFRYKNNNKKEFLVLIKDNPCTLKTILEWLLRM